MTTMTINPANILNPATMSDADLAAFVADPYNVDEFGDAFMDVAVDEFEIRNDIRNAAAFEDYYHGEIAFGDRGKCRRCAGTGAFITYVENGVPKGPGGPCFRCNGKGYQDDTDRRRNWGYDNYGVRVTL